MAAAAAAEDAELRALHAAVAALPTEAQATLLLDLLPSLPPAARADAAARAAASAAAHAAAAPRLAALMGARQKLARMAPKPLRARDQRDDIAVEAFHLRGEALMARCAALAADAHAVGVVAGLAARECEEALLVLAKALDASYVSDSDHGCDVAGLRMWRVPLAVAWVYRELLCAQVARGRGAPEELRAAVRHAVAVRGNAGARMAAEDADDAEVPSQFEAHVPAVRAAVGWRRARRRRRCLRTMLWRTTRRPRASSAPRRARRWSAPPAAPP
jgi:hypothetical protein